MVTDVLVAFLLGEGEMTLLLALLSLIVKASPASVGSITGVIVAETFLHTSSLVASALRMSVLCKRIAKGMRTRGIQ